MPKPSVLIGDYQRGVKFERERILNLMNSHRVVMSFNSFLVPVLTCNKCGDVTADQPSHLMRLIKDGFDEA